MSMLLSRCCASGKGRVMSDETLRDRGLQAMYDLSMKARSIAGNAYLEVLYASEISA